MTDFSVESTDSEKVQYKNILVNDRGSTKLGLFSLTGATIVLCCVGCEIGKQISNYSINYYNGGKYPLPQTLLVRNYKIKLLGCLLFSRWLCWNS